jgi:hypothetical protein
MSIEPLPKDWELIGLFECEPKCLDPSMPWSYNQLTFHTVRNNDEIICVIEPGDEVVEIILKNSGREIVNLDLHWVQGLEVQMKDGNEFLTIYFRDKNLIPLILQLKPVIGVKWGTSSSFPTY